MDDDELMMYDDDESFTAGDPAPDEIDWDAVQRLEARMAEALAEPEGEARSWAMLAMYDELYDGEAVIL